MTPKRIIWHHSADKSDGPQFDKINKYHKSRKFPNSSLGFYVGYHYVIEQNGDTVQARTPTEIGAHDTGENLNSIGICLAGDFTTSQPTEHQAAAAARLVHRLCTDFKIPITRVEPHRWDDDTACPGAALPDNWLIHQYLSRHAAPLVRLFWWLGERFNLL